MKRLKLFFACMLMAVFGVGNVWASVLPTEDFEKQSAGSTYNSQISYDADDSNAGMAWYVEHGTVSTNSKLNGEKSMQMRGYYAKNSAASAWNGNLPYLESKTAVTGLQSISLKIAAAATFKIDFMYREDGSSTWTAMKTDEETPSDATNLSFTTSASTVTYNIPSSDPTKAYFVKIVANSSSTHGANPSKAGNIVIRVDDVVFTYEGGESTKPTLSMTPTTDANFVGSQEITLSTTTDGASIYYTLDGTTPSSASTLYSSAFTITETKMVKAIAIKGSDESDVITRTFTKVEPLTTMDAIFTAATTAGSTAADKFVTFNNWVVTGVKGSNAYVTDGTKGFIIYASGHGFVVGNILSGTAACKVQLYNGSAELTNLTSSTTGLSVTTGGTVSTVVMDAEGIAALTGANTGSVIKISGSVTETDGKKYIEGVQLWNNLFNFTAPTVGKTYECTGVYCYHTTYGNEIMPRSAEDLSEVVAPEAPESPEFTPAPNTYNEAKSVTIASETEGAVVYYTMTSDGSTPATPDTNDDDQIFTDAISLNASGTYKFKAVAVKNDLSSAEVSATYTINLPLPSHDFQVTHHFSTGEGFEFPTGWGGSYAEHEIAFTDDKVYFASASHQSGTITDRPVTKSSAIELILTNAHKLITAVRFDYAQWGTKTQSFVMKYSTDGGTTYNAFDPAVTGSDFAIQALSLPENVNAIQVTGTNSSNQVGLTSIAFDLEDKPIVTKTVTITAPTNGTLVVKNGEDAISSGDEVEEGTILTIEATPAEGYKLTEVTVNGNAYTEATLELTENVTIAASFEENLAPLVTSYDLSEIGVVTSHLNGERVGDKVNLPLTAVSCSKTFVGWSANASCAVAPEYAPGAQYTLEANNILYAVYADPAASATWNVATSLEAGDVVVISTNTGYTAHEMKTAGAISSSLFSCLASTYKADNSQITALAEGTLQFTVGGNATDGWTLMNGTKYLKVTAAKKVNLVDDEETWNISFSGNNATLVPATGDLTNYSIQYNYNTGNDRFTAYNTNQVPISLYKQVAGYENYSTDCQAQVATPTFSPVAGTYTDVQNVTIACETEDVTIYYTTNGDDPTTSSTEYTAAIPVNESMMIKAIAVKSGMADSEIASAAYTINLPLSTMDQIFDAATAAGGTATDVNITFGNWVVSGVSTNGKNVFVTDGTKGFIIYDGGGEMGFAVGNVLSGTAACKVQLFKGAAELTTLSSSTEGLNVATGGVITPEVKAISALSGINTGAPVIINSVQFDGTNLTDGANSIKPYNALYNYDALTENTYYNVTGIYQQFDNTKEILPRSAADIDEVELSDPELSYSPASVSLEVGEALNAPTFNNPHELAVTYAVTGDPVATVTNEGVIALVENATGTAVITASFTGNGTYAAGNATFTITVSEPVDAKNVVILAEYNSKFYAMINSISNKTAAAVEVEKDGDKIVVASEGDKAAIQWKKITNGENTTFQDANDKYLKGVSNGGDLTLADAVCNWSWNATDKYYYIGTRSFIYRESANGFKNYAVQNAGTSDYSALAEVIEIDPANIVITSKVDPQLAFNPTSVELTVGGSFTPATLNYAEGFDGLAAVTYASSNTDLATVEGNVVSLVADAIGTATITATFAGNNNYLAGSASYTITVNEAGDDLSGTWRLANAVVAGQKIIIGSTKGADTYAMGKQNPNNRAAVASTIDGDILTPGAATKVFTLVDAGDGKFAIQASNGKYLTSATSGSSNNLLEADDYDLDNAKWTISIEEGVASIVAAAGSKTVMQYNSGNTLFSCYGSASQTDVKIYSTTSVVRTELTEGWYYTMCLDKAVTAVKAGSIWRVLSKAANGTDVILEEVIGTLDAGRPYIFYATAANLEVAYTGDAVSAPLTEGNNGLVGSFGQVKISQSENNYIIYNNALYYVNTNNVYVGANRAYLNMLDVPAYSEPQQQGAPRRRVTMAVNGPQVATGMESIQPSEVNIQKVMIDGKLFIIRGEKMFDATGRLVK